MICGIPDAIINKSVLYDATSIPEFKVKLELYERMHEKLVAESKTGNMMKGVFTAPMPDLNVSVVRYYNCDDGEQVPGVSQCWQRT